MAERPAQSTDTELRRAKPFIKATTTGRKSGAKRVAPLIFLADGPRIVLVASQGGLPKHPVWFLNLEASPDVSFETREHGVRSYRARRASAEEKSALWPRLRGVYSDYADYQARTERDIPVVVLEPR